MSQYNIPVPFPPEADYKRQSAEVPGTQRPGQTGHYRCTAYDLLTLQSPRTFKTLTEIFDEGLRRAGDGPFLGHRPLVSKKPLKYADHYEWLSWPQVDVRRRALGSAVYKLFQSGALGGGQIDTVGIWSKNMPEWQVIDLALQAYGMVGVSLYDTLGKDSVEYIINHAEITIVFATSDHIPFLLNIASKVPGLKVVVAMDDISDKSKEILAAWGREKNIEIQTMHDLEEMGAGDPVEPITATADQLATICYTSGTTGNPKGVLLTHGNLASDVHSQLHAYNVHEDRCSISYLPLAHIYERVMALCNIAVGGRVGFSTGDPLRLLEDMQVLKPTFVAAVPRVLNRIYQAVMVAGSAPGLKGKLFRHATEVKIQRLHIDGERSHPLWDRLVFKKVAAAMGGKVELMACGSAPISPTVMNFLRIALCCDILEGYGMTENGGTCTHVWPKDPTSSGTVGPPVPNIELKLVDVPAMGYTAQDRPYPRGEICCRGDGCFIGYFKDEKNTVSTIDEEGWTHTGDVGQFDECGRLKIVDRVKNIMKLAQGEYVALENIENVYSSCPLVSQLFVHGDSLQSYLLAIVVPDPIQFAGFLSRLWGEAVTPEEVGRLEEALRDPKVNAALLTELTKQAHAVKLRGFEMIKRIHLTLDPFTVENGCLTPTFKVRRKETYNKFKRELDALYDLPPPPTSGKL
ncbi:acetyl-CoA synthetase-like protein [Laetiporus sulphureus 93-53]|uniref:Acetyl-CoA synthetase-like protein n=1 Tax=Laetiporus sulphureus 93-53 TaxID=1314785 RepID=A0A165H901_9APHY|nr:acetyl-CoA synthetase-like protein [Laetiporus sulphureus 93-53]KZT11408.1 acetyl-CoA synthetase-like protein [Laetiporus sulphureus 93-53]